VFILYLLIVEGIESGNSSVFILNLYVLEELNLGIILRLF